MKKNTLLIYAALCLLIPQIVNAQSFTIDKSEIQIDYSEKTSGINGIFPTNNNINISWRVVKCTFPEDWLRASGFCDNFLCYEGYGLCYNNFSKLSMAYVPNATEPSGIFYSFDLSQATSAGEYSITLELQNVDIPEDVVDETYTVKYGGQPAPGGTLTLFPNPAFESINIGYDYLNVATINIYNFQGTLVNTIQQPYNNIIVDISNYPQGFYIVHLLDSYGSILAYDNFAHY